MAKDSKRKLGEWTHEKSGITVPYFLSGTRFVCTVLEVQLDAPEAAVLRDKVMDRLEHWMTMEWFPVIHVECNGDGRSSYREEPEGEEIALKVRRFYLSRSPAGRVMSVEWECDESHRKAKMRSFNNAEMELTRLPLKAPFPLSKRREQGHISVLIDYDEAVWESLARIIEGVAKLRIAISELVKDKHGIAKLVSGGEKLLMLGSGKK